MGTKKRPEKMSTVTKGWLSITVRMPPELKAEIDAEVARHEPMSINAWMVDMIRRVLYRAAALRG